MGRLVLLTTPIGNIKDITIRAKEKLESAELIVAEDTRSLKELLHILGISISGKQVLSFHDQSPTSQISLLQKELEQDKELVLVSEAGSPIISDPAYPLVKMALDNGHEVDSLPGASSPICALELSGLAPNPFHFVGFLPRGDKEKTNTLGQALDWRGTVIFFESGQRLESTLKIIGELDPSASVVVARELTKKFQTIYRFIAADWTSQLEAMTMKGEFVVLVESTSKKRASSIQSEEIGQLAQACLERPGDKGLSKLLAAILGRSPKEIYSQLINKS